MYIPLDHDSPQTLPRQISGYLAELIRHGHLGPAARLPATRALAKSLGVSKNTVEAAYEDLKARKLVHVRPGQAAVVRRNIPEDTEQHLPFREPRGRDPLPARAWLSPAETAEEEICDLAGFGPRLPNVSSRQLRAFHEDALAEGRTPLFSAPPPLGESALRAAASRHLARCGVLRGADDVAVLPSRPDAMERILRLFVPPGGLVLADSLLDPDLMLPVRARKARVAVLPETPSGLAAAVKRLSPRLLVVVTGASRLPGRPPGIARRRALLDLAKEKGIPVVEDVTNTDELPAPVPAPLAVLESSGRVFPLCDLSDEAGGEFTACVVGAGPKALERLRAGKSAAKPLDRLAQRALAGALDSPARTRALRKVREQRKLLQTPVARSFRRRFPEIRGHEFSVGSEAVRLDLPEGVSGAELQEAAQEHGILIRSARDCGAKPAEDTFVLLDLTRHEEGELLDGLRRLGQALDGLLEASDQG
jgi:GntR family transcriptional regulator/MocR family aminotransferase